MVTLTIAVILILIGFALIQRARNRSRRRRNILPFKDYGKEPPLADSEEFTPDSVNSIWK